MSSAVAFARWSGWTTGRASSRPLQLRGDAGGPGQLAGRDVVVAAGSEHLGGERAYRLQHPPASCGPQYDQAFVHQPAKYVGQLASRLARVGGGDRGQIEAADKKKPPAGERATALAGRAGRGSSRSPSAAIGAADRYPNLRPPAAAGHAGPYAGRPCPASRSARRPTRSPAGSRPTASTRPPVVPAQLRTYGRRPARGR